MDSKSLAPFLLLSTAFVAALIAANVVSGKIIAVAGLFVPAGVLAYSITFAVTDTVCEVWGRQRTQLVVNAGFAVQLLVNVGGIGHAPHCGASLVLRLADLE